MILGQVHLHHGRTACKRPEAYSDAEALDKGDVILAFFPFAFFLIVSAWPELRHQVE